MRIWTTIAAIAASLTLGLGSGLSLARAEELPKELVGVGIDEKLGTQVDPSITFTDHTGRQVALRDVLAAGKPVLLTLNYYGCPMLCGVQLNFLTDMLKQLDWTPGKEFSMLTVSFNPRESNELAGSKHKGYLKALGREGAEWTFGTATEANIARLADAVGYRFKYLPETQEYAHPAAIMFLSPSGKVSRYVYGLTYLPRDIKFALMDASEGKVGGSVDKLIMSCFHYDPTRGSYVPFAWGIMRLGAAAATLALVSLIVVLRRRELAAANA